LGGGRSHETPAEQRYLVRLEIDDSAMAQNFLSCDRDHESSRTSEERRHVLRVVRPNGQVGRVFEICDLDEVLAFGN